MLPERTIAVAGLVKYHGASRSGSTPISKSDSFSQRLLKCLIQSDREVEVQVTESGQIHRENEFEGLG